MATKKLPKKHTATGTPKIKAPARKASKKAVAKPTVTGKSEPATKKRSAGATAKPKKAATVSEASEVAGIDVGARAPSFVLQDHTGTVVSSESLRGSNYVIYFYPKDDTPGCTLEACSFRDSTPRFNAKGVKVLGVSPDSTEAHARFRKKYDLSFPLLSDPEKTLAKAYGVWVKKQNYGREYMGVERSTFFVDRHGVVKKVWRRVRVPGHVDEVVHSV